MWLEPVALAGRHVRLEPLSLDHLDGLCQAGLDTELWRWSTAQVVSPEGMRRYVEAALRDRDLGTALPFAILSAADRRVIGSTRFGNADPTHRRVEIGWSWVASPWQRTGANTECKLLLLRHAFDSLACIRVEFKTDLLNQRSRRAIARLGAREEGVLRAHMITDSGRVRDTVYFSILASEWPHVRRALEARLASGSATASST